MDEVEVAFPLPHPTDGTVASRGHDQNSPRSDHRPHPYTGVGMVRAVDTGIHDDEGDGLFEALRLSEDERIRYVIYRGEIFSYYNHSNGPAWSVRPYTGGGHLSHVHVSVRRDKDIVSKPWNLDLEGGDMAYLDIEELQEALNEAGRTDADGNPLEVDGIYGPKTKFAFVSGLLPAATGVDAQARAAAAGAHARADTAHDRLDMVKSAL